jgi:hypothetical protein
MPSETASTPTEVLALLELPALDALTKRQTEGGDCVWCATPLTAETAVDLGERTDTDGTHRFPRACHPCTGTAAYRALLDHGPVCEQCVDNADQCEVGRGLRRLIREGRR